MVKYTIKFANQTSMEVDEEQVPALLKVYSPEIEKIEFDGNNVTEERLSELSSKFE